MDVPRIHLPVLVDRRFVLRGMAATLLASLAGCATHVRSGSSDEMSDGETPDGGTPGSSSTPPPPPSAGFERCGTELCISLADPANAALRTVDGARVIVFENKRLLVIRLEPESFLVLSAVCTHSGCTVRYSASSADIECPCHGSRFTLDGDVTEGPADAPLATYSTSYDAATDVLRVTLDVVRVTL